MGAGVETVYLGIQGECLTLRNRGKIEAPTKYLTAFISFSCSSLDGEIRIGRSEPVRKRYRRRE